jgi:hypothetical protein
MIVHVCCCFVLRFEGIRVCVGVCVCDMKRARHSFIIPPSLHHVIRSTTLSNMNPDIRVCVWLQALFGQIFSSALGFKLSTLRLLACLSNRKASAACPPVLSICPLISCNCCCDFTQRPCGLNHIHRLRLKWYPIHYIVHTTFDPGP